MKEGTVKTVTEKGFGFIHVEGQEKDIFYHESTLQGDLAERKLRVGDRVTFDVQEGEKGLSATNIKLVEATE